MAYNLKISFLTTLSLLVLFPCICFAKSTTPSAICASTPYPSYCKSLLPNTSSDVYECGRFSVRKSVVYTTHFLSLIDKYIARSSSLSSIVVAALQDCKFLAMENLDYLMDSLKTVNTTSQILPSDKADDTQTLLSAILTNTQTCLDGLQDASPSPTMQNDVYSTISNNTKLYSVSLALFTQGWVPKNKIKTNSKGSYSKLKDGKLNLKMSQKNKALYDSASNRKSRKLYQNNDKFSRKLLQSDSNEGVIVISDIVVVCKDRIFNYTSINDAIDAAPNNTDGTSGYFLIYVTAGVYEEYVLIPKYKKFLIMIGDGINQTVITGNRSVVDGWTTFNSATFAVVAQRFIAVGITFQNTAGAIKHQAVAVRNGADLSTFYSCSFEGFQDTLYVHSLRHFYKECDVYGTVDFIFGNAASVLQSCNIYPRLPMSGQFNAITAQGRSDPNQNTGISIQNCTIKAAEDLASSSGTTKTYLGRPWKEYSRTVYMQSFMDSLIDPLGWHDWNGDFALNTSYYAEFNNWGPGSDTSGRVTWPGFHIINETDATNFTVSSFLSGDDWLPQTGVPYTSGL